MKHFQTLGLTSIVAILLAASAGVGAASATELYSGSTTLGVGVPFTLSLKVSTTMVVKDTGGSTNDTCKWWHMEGHITGILPPKIKVTSQTVSGCSHKTTVLSPGELEIKHIAGTTNGSVISTGMEMTIESTVFGISCIAKTGTGTTIGTITGVKSGEATMDVNGVIPLGAFCGDSTWTGTAVVSSPGGLNVEEK